MIAYKAGYIVFKLGYGGVRSTSLVLGTRACCNGERQFESDYPNNHQDTGYCKAYVALGSNPFLMAKFISHLRERNQLLYRLEFMHQLLKTFRVKGKSPAFQIIYN